LQIFDKGNKITGLKNKWHEHLSERTQAEQLKPVGRTEVGSQSGRGERICEDLYVTGTGCKNYLTLMMIIIIIIITMTKMIW